MIQFTNPFTGEFLLVNANPEGHNQYWNPDEGVPEKLSGRRYGTHVSSNLASLDALEDRPHLGMSLARHRGEEMSSPTISEPKGDTGRALVRIVGEGLDYDRPDHKEYIDALLEEDPYNVIDRLREQGVDWVNGWNSIGSDDELHLISPSKAKVLKKVKASLEKLGKQSRDYRNKLDYSRL